MLWLFLDSYSDIRNVVIKYYDFFRCYKEKLYHFTYFFKQSQKEAIKKRDINGISTTVLFLLKKKEEEKKKPGK